MNAMPIQRKLIQNFTHPVPGRAFLLSPLVVLGTTWLLFQAQLLLMRADKVPNVRSFSIGYLIPLVLLTFLGGRLVGAFTLVLSALASVYVLTEPRFSFHIIHARDEAELILLLVVGSVLIGVAGAFHATLRDFAAALSEAKLENEARTVAAAVDDACLVRSCAVTKTGLDYSITLEAHLCRAVSAAEARAIADAIEQRLRRINPFVAQATVRLDSPQERQEGSAP